MRRSRLKSLWRSSQWRVTMKRQRTRCAMKIFPVNFLMIWNMTGYWHWYSREYQYSSSSQYSRGRFMNLIIKKLINWYWWIFTLQEEIKTLSVQKGGEEDVEKLEKSNIKVSFMISSFWTSRTLPKSNGQSSIFQGFKINLIPGIHQQGIQSPY